MPIIPKDINDINFSERDLFLDVRLTTVSITDPPKRTDSGFLQKDFTGRPTFETGFFRDGIGFGITNVKITTNASLQPLVEIDFKDLYGKTVFGELQDSPESPINYGAIFQWPPPKFEFTFKGYLGKPVTWILNLKSTSTDYNSDDGSYSIKTVFVPNQWGMFADIPFLYLYAVKKLRMDALGTTSPSESSDNKSANGKNTEDNSNFSEESKKIQSIFDIMYIGKKVEKQKQERSKEYDSLINQLTLLKQDPIGGLVSGNLKIPSKGEFEKINSEVPGFGEIKSFTPIKLTLPPDKIYQKTNNSEILLYLKRLSSLKADQRNIENLRIKIATFSKTKGNSDPQILKDIRANSSDLEGTKIARLKTEANKLDSIIDKNLDDIDTAIKGRLFQKNEEEIAKLTICEVFGQIARDTAFIMGYILDAGEQGYLSAPQARQDAEQNGAIGLYYPMVFKKEQNSDGTEEIGKQVPANADNVPSSFGNSGEFVNSVENYELAFVNEFITAVSFGIANNRALQARAEQGGRRTVKNRVTNAELISENPFLNKTDWKEIGSIILKRAGIAGYLTQSNDPNCVGDYCNTAGRSDSAEEIRELADSDVTNITDDIVIGLDTENFEQLKDFCDFFLVLFESEGEELGGKEDFVFKELWKDGNRPWQGGVGKGEITKGIVVLGNPVTELIPNGFEQIVSEELINNSTGAFWGEEEISSLPNNVLNSFYNKEYNEINVNGELRDSGFKAYTVEQYLGNFIGERYLFYGRTSGQAKRGQRYVRPSLYNTANFYNGIGYATYMNGLFIMHPNSGSDHDDVYWHVVFDDESDIQLLDEFVPTNTSDTEFDDEDKEAGYPKGLLDIDSLVDGDDKELQRVKFLNKRSEENRVIDYSFIKNTVKLPLDLEDGKFKTLKKDDKDIVDLGGQKVLSLSYVDIDRSNILWNKQLIDSETPADEGRQAINVDERKIVYTVYGQNWDSNKACPTFGLFGSSDLANSSRVFLRQFCKSLKAKLVRIEDEQNKIFGSVLGRAGDHSDLIYQQMHNLFHQWQILAHLDGKRIIDTEDAKKGLHANIAFKLEDIYSSDCKNTVSSLSTAKERKSTQKEVEESSTSPTPVDCNKLNDGSEIQGGFRYDYPLQPIGKNQINVAESVINIDTLYRTKANTTVLNSFQQLASKNNFMFFPIPGNPDYDCISDIFQPVTTVRNPKVGNYFQVLFQPTPESRSLLSDNTNITTHGNPESFAVQAFPVRFGDPTNKIIKNVTVGTDDNKVTAESVVNLQRIVDNENKNKSVTTDCSLLSVFEGRSYTAKIETLGNAQLSPMQFFYLQNHTIFTGLYQIMKVEHSISPNDMTTNFQGIKMRYGGNSGYGGVHPITLQDFRNAANSIINAPFETGGSVETGGANAVTSPDGGGVGVEDVSGLSDTVVSSVDVGQGGEVSTTEIQMPPKVKEFFRNSNRFGTGEDGTPIPANGNPAANLKKSDLIKNMNEFLADRWGPFAEFLEANYPEKKNEYYITSAIRVGSATSQHGKGQASDFGIASSDVSLKMRKSYELLNILMQFHRVNNLHYDQILFETRDSGSVWIHWSYRRNEQWNQRLRFHNDHTVQGAPMNTKKGSNLSSAVTNLSSSEARVNKFNGSA